MALNPDAVPLPPGYLAEPGGLTLKDIVDRLNLGLLQGNGSPAGVIVADVGTLYRRLDGTPTLWVKESGSGSAAGWVSK